MNEIYLGIAAVIGMLFLTAIAVLAVSATDGKQRKKPAEKRKPGCQICGKSVMPWQQYRFASWFDYPLHSKCQTEYIMRKAYEDPGYMASLLREKAEYRAATGRELL